MTFSVSNGGLDRSLDFKPDSVTLTEKDLFHEKTKCSQEFPPEACRLLLSQRQDFWNNHLAQFQFTHNQQRTTELRD